MDRSVTNNRIRSGIGGVAKAAVITLLTWGVMGVSCDQDAQTVFRHTATEPIGAGVKAILAGDPASGLAQIVSAGIDGLVASIDQAGKPESKK